VSMFRAQGREPVFPARHPSHYGLVVTLPEVVNFCQKEESSRNS
jgi:hypothetical protein